MKHFIISVLLNLSLFGFSLAQADSPPDEAFPQLDNAEQAVWEIHHPDQEENGTGFFVGPNRFITSFRVINKLLRQSASEDRAEDHRQEDQNALDRIVLSRKGSLSFLGIQKVLVVSALYDLVLLETKERVTDYLSLRQSSPEPDENLFLTAYLKGNFTGIRKTGDFLYEDDQRYDFPVNHSFLRGVSGSPVLDEQGQVVGMAFLGIVNELAAVQPDHLRDLIEGNIGIKCVELNSLNESVNPDSIACIKREIEGLVELAEKGFVYAQYKLAFIYHRGDGVQQDLEEAFHWNKKAAEQDHVVAQHNLAGMYLDGRGVQQDFEKAFEWYERSAGQGFALAQFHLAGMYYDGKGVEQDFGKALEWYERSAEQGYAPAQFHLAGMYYDGKGVEQDFGKALEWYERSAKQGHVLAQSNLAWMYYYGKGVEQDFEKAFEWYERSAGQGFALAQFHLAGMYYYGKGVEQDFGKALEWYERSAEQGYAPAQFHLAGMYYDGKGVEQDFGKALEWYERSVERAMLRLKTIWA